MLLHFIPVCCVVLLICLCVKMRLSLGGSTPLPPKGAPKWEVGAPHPWLHHLAVFVHGEAATSPALCRRFEHQPQPINFLRQSVVPAVGHQQKGTGSMYPPFFGSPLNVVINWIEDVSNGQYFCGKGDDMAQTQQKCHLENGGYSHIVHVSWEHNRCCLRRFQEQGSLERRWDAAARFKFPAAPLGQATHVVKVKPKSKGNSFCLRGSA